MANEIGTRETSDMPQLVVVKRWGFVATVSDKLKQHTIYGRVGEVFLSLGISKVTIKPPAGSFVSSNK